MIYNKANILSGYNFARISDFIFAENLIDENFNPITTVFDIDVSLIKEESIIFCKTDFIDRLFYKINIFPEWYNLKLITHESDYEINKQIFNLKPACINKWYGINIVHDNPNLIPIPLGIGNDHSRITLKIENINNKNIVDKKKLLYINHRINTYPQARNWLYEYFNANDWCTVDQPNLDLATFQNKLLEHSFMLCPRGNGIDTHRLWECLYLGVIPIVEKHITNKNMNDLPILFVNNFKEINKDMLLSNYDLLKNKSLDKLNIKYWEKIIRGNI